MKPTIQVERCKHCGACSWNTENGIRRCGSCGAEGTRRPATVVAV